MNKVRSRVTSIIPDSLSKWFSPTTEQRNVGDGGAESGPPAEGGADEEQQTSSQQHNGKRKRSRRRIRLVPDDGIMDDVIDAQDLDEEEVQLADNIAEHDLAAEDEQTRRSEYNVMLLRKRQLANDDDDDDDEDVEEEEDEEPEDLHNYQQQRQLSSQRGQYNPNSSGNNINSGFSSSASSVSQPLQKRKRLEVSKTTLKEQAGDRRYRRGLRTNRALSYLINSGKGAKYPTQRIFRDI